MDPKDLSIVNPNPTKLPGPNLLHQLVAPPGELQALEHLCRSSRTSYSYRDLHNAADNVACEITRVRGENDPAGSELVVPVLIPQSPSLYISLLAILKAGGAFCPLNIDAPPERIKFILEDVSAKVVLVSEDLASKIPSETNVSIICVDHSNPRCKVSDVEHRIPSPEDLAYVMYTSGSTGTPKGVGISHTAATQALLAHDRCVPAFSRFLQFAAPTFDVSVFEIFFPLFRGSTLICVRREEMLDDLPAVLREMDVDACELTPTVAGSLLRMRKNAPKLKLLLTIGEMLNAPVVEEFGGSSLRDSMLWAMYGPTEATIHCTLQSALPSASSTGNIGTPLETVSCFIVEPCNSPGDSGNFKILPTGEVGELAVGGYQLARGYLNRPEQTASAFVSTPYGRLYRTGDRARLTADGTLECLGRLANGQVKLRGQRIELGEIEQVVLKTSGCHSAVAAVVDSNLVVFCAVDSGVTEEAIVTSCERWLPRFMVPGELVMMQEFPRLPSGKVDTKQLKADFSERKSAELRDEDAKIDQDQDILRVMANTLGLKVSKNMSLASAGVDSLAAIRLASSLRVAGFKTSAPDLLKQRTISDLCSSLRERPLASLPDHEPLNISLLADLEQILSRCPALQNETARIGDILPCTPLQSAMLAETVQNPMAYWNDIRLQTGPGVSSEHISYAFHQLMQQNESLRTGFVQWHGGHVAIVFKTIEPTSVHIVHDSRGESSSFALQDLLTPFRVQIHKSDKGDGVQVLIQAHHAVYDGWSLDMIISNVAALLNQVPLPSRPQFREVVKFHARKSRKEADDLARTFWSHHLLGWNKTPFPKLSARSSGTREIITIKETLPLTPKMVQEALQKLQLGAQVVFQSALALVWSGIAGDQDMVLGSVTSGRTIPVNGIENVLGPCIASLPIRVDLNSIVAISDLLRSVHASNRAIMEHCTLPLSEIKKLTGLQPAEPLYDVLFVYQESLDSKEKNAHPIKEVDHLDRLETKLLLEVEPRASGYVLQITYHSSSFPSKFATYFMQQFKDITRRLIEKPDESIQFTMSSVSCGASIYNDNLETFQGTPDLAAVFEATAQKMPTANALTYYKSSESSTPQMMTLSYEELNVDANKVAHFLSSCGVQTGEIVAIIMSKSTLLYTCILGIIKAGGAYLPILPTTPIKRVREILRQARTKRCLIDTASFSTFSPIDDIQFLDTEAMPLQDFSEEDLNIPHDPDRLAYVIYTSGTTGVPKGVAVTQRNIVSNIAHLRSIYPTSSDKQPQLLQACSHAFDVSVFEIFFAWHAGMCLCSANNDVLFEDLEKSICLMDITHLSLTPTVASLIDPAKVPGVEFLVTAGEPMTLAVLNRWGDRLWQGYGPSETTNICSVKRMAHGENIEHLGWVFPNTSVFVLQPSSLDVVPIGWVGELCFGGDQVAQGYLNEPRLTAEKFVQHAQFGRIYRSGDIGRMLSDGSLVILGRIDDQIKLRGQRIEAAEINNIMTSTGLAESAVTMSVQCSKGSLNQLASFYVPSEANAEYSTLNIEPETNRMLFATLKSRVPSYMVPSYLIPLSQIPLTSSGKLDRRHLQETFGELTQSHLEKVSCTTQTLEDDSGWNTLELSIAHAISNLCNTARDGIGRWTPFAALGVDSISAIEIARALRSDLGTRITISDILQNPSVAQLGKFLHNREPSLGAVRNVPDVFAKEFADEVRKTWVKDHAAIEDVLPCTPLQEAMLSQSQGSYYNKILLRLHIRADDIREYWDEMSRRHGILRTCFVTTDNAAYPIAQVILRNWKILWNTFDVHAPSLAGAAHEHLKALPEPLDSKVPPLSFAFIRYKGSIFLSFICHHALYDGVAMGNLWREVEALANSRTLPPPVPYKPFMREALSLPKDTDAFWAEQFREFRPTTLFPRLAGSDINQCLHNTSLGMPHSETQERLRTLGVSMLSVCQAAWANVLAIASQNADVAFGNVVSGRTLDIDGLDQLVAPCFNTIPLRMDLSKNLQNIDVLRHFQQLNSQMLQYQFTSLRRVQKIANCLRRNLFDTLLLLQQPLQDMDESVWTLEEDSGNMDVPLVCEVVPCPNLNSIVVNVHYDIGIVSGDIATIMAGIFKYAFRHFIDLPFSIPVDRTSLPPALSTGLSELVPRREKYEHADQLASDADNWTDTEMSIRDVISRLSRVPEAKVSRLTTIFHLGLDSINAVQVASMLRQKGYKLSVSDVIECSSCAKLARRIMHNSSRRAGIQPFDLDKFAHDVSAQVITKVPTASQAEAILPCTAVQSAMLASFIQSSGHNYLNMLTYKIDDCIRIGDLVEAWRTLQRSHPMLRTGFVPVRNKDSTFAMIRQPADSIDTPVSCTGSSSIGSFDLQEWRNESQQAILLNLHSPPWKVVLFDNGCGLMMCILIHHALYDAQSLDEMLGSLSSQLRREKIAFPRVEPALADILSQSLKDQEQAKDFWEKQAVKVVVNKFPLMTPLREERASLLTHTTVASVPLKLLREATQDLGISIQVVVQAAWTRLLSSYLGESSVVFGVTMSGRTTDETQNASFPCITTVPIVAVNVTSNKELVQNMMEYNSQLHKNQFVPLSSIQKWLGHPASPVFDTLVVYQKRSSEATAGPWTLVEDDAAIDYPISLEVEAIDDDRVLLCITYADHVIPTEQARLLAQQFDAILGHLLREPDGMEHDLYKQEPGIFAIMPAAIPEMVSPVHFLHQFVEARSATHPDSVALEFVSGYDNGSLDKRTWTYREFDLMGNRIANLLRESTTPGDIVAIHFQKCPEAYFTILGTLKAGCAFVALDPNAPKSRKEFILRDSRARCILTDGTSTLDFDISTKLLRISEELLQTYSESSPKLGDGFTPANTCYCLYTSGTTGTPKGCEITHENAVQAMMAFQDLFSGHWAPDSRWLQFAALHFDVSVLEQYWSWSVGITVVAAPRDLILDDLTGSINDLEITHIDLTPSLARLTHPDEMPSLCRGVFITGGEQLKQEILDAWGSKAVIYNAYGPTEATIGVTMYQRVPVNGRPSNIGPQFPNVGSYVFCPGTEIPVLRGGVGELCVSGKLVGKGYLNRPSLTNERFPTLAGFGERIYRTGDLVRILHDGCFDFLGRADDQVKLRGQRLEIGEINHTIRTGAPEIKDAATIVIRHESCGKDVLVSFLVGNSDNDSRNLCVLPDVYGLAIKARTACLERLPGYMVPTYFLLLSHIPLSPNNKVEAKELKALYGSLSPEQLMNASSASTRSADSSLDKIALQKAIRVLSDFSNIPERSLSPSTSIFDLGVDSITALQLSTQLRTAGFDSALPAVLLRCPVIADLVRALTIDAGTTSHIDLVREAKQAIRACHQRYRALVCRELGVELDKIEYIAPCTPLQQGIISKALTSDTGGAYFNSFDLQFDSHVSMDRVLWAWTRLLKTHAILRSAFVNTSDGHVQVALKDKARPWQEFTTRAESDDVSILAEIKQDWIRRNMNHIRDPIQLVHVCGLGVQKIVIHIFHALYDGNSFEIMNQQAAAFYHEIQPKLGPTFIEALAHGPLRRHDSCQQFWREHLRGWAFSPIPTLMRNSIGESPVILTRTVSLRLFEKLRAEQNVTLQSVVLAIWAYVLQKHLARKLTIGVVVGGRSIGLSNVDKTVGPLFNTVPFFNDTLTRHTLASLIHECHEFSASVMPFQHVPLKSVQKWCTGGQPLFDNLFVFQLEQPNMAEKDVPWTVVDTPGHPDYPLAFEATRTHTGELRLCLVAQNRVADSSLLETLLDQVEEAVARTKSEALLESSGISDPNNSDETLIDSTGTASSDVTLEQYSWTDQALVMRNEVATLTDIPINDVNATTTMLELGLDSIDAIKLSTRLKRRGIHLSASQIMRHQTIQRLVQENHTIEPGHTTDSTNHAHLEEIRAQLHAQVTNSGIDSSIVESVSPPTALQESMVAGMIQSEFQWYFNHDILEVSDGVDMKKLEEAWATVIKQSPILRTGFVEVDDASLDMAYGAVVFRNTSPCTRNITLSSLSDLWKLTSNATQLAVKGRGLKYLLQLTFATHEQRRFVIVSISHALYDGWSLSLMYQDLEMAYKGVVAMRPSVDTFISRMIASRTEDAQIFWGNYLDGLSPSILAANKSSKEPTSDRVFRAEIASKETLSEVTGFCKKNAFSLQALSLACWAMTVAEHTKSLDVAFGLVLSGRDFEGAEDLMYPTMNTVVLRCILHGTVSGFISYVEGTLSDIREFQAFPLRKAQAAAKLGNSDTFDSLFLLQKSPEQALSSSPLLASIGGSSAVDYPVCVEAEPTADQLIWRIACQADLFTQEESKALVNKLDQILQYILGAGAADVLSFHGGEVSICGMPTVAIQEARRADGVAVTEEPSSDHSWGETATIIRNILSQVSGVPAESITSSSTLYHLGLDSISAVKVSLLLRKKAVHLRPRELTTSSSILEMASQARLVDESEQEQLQPPPTWTPPSGIDVDKYLQECNIQKDSVEAIIPATAMQVYMLTAWQNNGGAVFFPEFCFRISGDVDEAQVQRAWQTLNSQIPILRIRFVATGSNQLPWIQVIVRKEAVLSGRVSQPLTYLSVTKADADQALIIRLRIHHALYDGVSLPAVISQFCCLLSNDSGTKEQDYSQWARTSIQPTLEDVQTRRREFWAKYLAQTAPTSPSALSSLGSQCRTSHIDEAAIRDVAHIREFASNNRISLQSLFLAAYARCIASQAGGDTSTESTVIFGIYLANRAADYSSPPLIYPTLNLVPLKVKLGLNESLAAVATSIQNDIHTISSEGRAEVGLWEIFSWTGVKVDSFVNFLSLPDNPEPTPEAVTLTPMHGVKTLPWNHSELLAEPWLQHNAVKEAFPASVDIEASVKGRQLTIGIFGPHERVSDESATKMVADITRLLDGVGV